MLCSPFVPRRFAGPVGARWNRVSPVQLLFLEHFRRIGLLKPGFAVYWFLGGLGHLEKKLRPTWASNRPKTRRTGFSPALEVVSGETPRNQIRSQVECRLGPGKGSGRGPQVKKMNLLCDIFSFLLRFEINNNKKLKTKRVLPMQGPGVIAEKTASALQFQRTATGPATFRGAELRPKRVFSIFGLFRPDRPKKG